VITRAARGAERERYVLCSEGEGGAGDGGGQVEALGDLAPQLLVDDFHQAALRHDQLEQLVQVQGLLRHDRDPVHGGA